MHKYREYKHQREFKQAKTISVIVTLILIFICINTSYAQTPKPDETKEQPQTKPNKTEDKKAEDPAKLAKNKELTEILEKLLNAQDASRTLVFNTILMKAAQDKDYVKLINNEILVNKLERNTLRELLDTMAAVGNTSKELLQSEFIPNLLILRINPDFSEKIDKILKTYSIDSLYKGVEAILIGIKEVNFDNQNVIRFAIDLASNEEFFSIIYQIKFINPLINLLNVKLDSEPGKENNHNGIGIIYEIVHKKINNALAVITSYTPATNDFAGWSSWWTEFQKKPEVEQYKTLLENAHKRFSQKNKELTELREGTIIQKLRQNSKSYDVNAASLSDPSNNVVLVALDHIISIVNEGLFDAKNRENLVKTLYNTWYSDVSVEVKKKITDLFLKLGGSEATLRVLFSYEKGIEIRRYIVERLSFDGKEGASLDKLIQIINKHTQYPAEITKAAIIGLGKWNNYKDEGNVKIVLKTLKEIITISDVKTIEQIAVANTINELAGKFDISELIVHLFEVQPFKPQQLVVLLLSALRSGNSPKLAEWVISFELKNEYLTGILKDRESFNDLIEAVFDILVDLKEPFIEPTVYTALYDALGELYHNPPEGANGSFKQKLENALTRIALPYNPEKKYAELSDDRKKSIAKTALIVPELLMKRSLSDFVLNRLLPAYPPELVQAKQNELNTLNVRLGLRSETWDQLDIFTKYKSLVEKKQIPNEKVKDDILWSISLRKNVDTRIAPRLIYALQNVNPQTFEFVWKTIFEFADKQHGDLKSPLGEIYIFQIYDMIFNLESMKALIQNPTDKNLQAFLKLRENATVSYNKWFADTEASWLKFAELNSDALDFAKIGENYRVVLSNLITRLIKAGENAEQVAKIWKFIDEISTEKNLSLPRYKDAMPKNEIVKTLKEMETAIKKIALK